LQNTTPVYREPAVAVNGLIVRLDGKAIIYWSIKDG